MHLMAIVNTGNTKRLLQAIEAGADVNVIDSVGNTPVHAAVASRNIEMLKLLIKLGAQVDQKNNMKETPLDIAIYNRRFNMMKELIEAGAVLDDDRIFMKFVDNDCGEWQYTLLKQAINEGALPIGYIIRNLVNNLDVLARIDLADSKIWLEIKTGILLANNELTDYLY